MTDVARYVALPYTKIVRADSDGDFVARVAELNGCVAHGATEEEALANLREVQTLWIEEALSAGQSIPTPEEEDSLPSGRWLQRAPRSLHRKIADLARRDAVSLNQFVVSVLAEAVGASTAKPKAELPAGVQRIEKVIHAGAAPCVVFDIQGVDWTTQWTGGNRATSKFRTFDADDLARFSVGLSEELKVDGSTEWQLRGLRKGASADHYCLEDVRGKDRPRGVPAAAPR